MHQDPLRRGDLTLEPDTRVEVDHVVGGTYGDWNDVAVRYAGAANEGIDARGTRP